MGQFRVRAKANEDLIDIGRTSRDTYGLEQMVKYITGLTRLFENIAAHPALGRPCPPRLPKGMRQLPYGSHIVFYVIRAHNSHVEIVRVLHAHMHHAKDLLS